MVFWSQWRYHETKFKSQGLHSIRIKYWNASGSGSTSSFIPAHWNIGILLHKQAKRRTIMHTTVPRIRSWTSRDVQTLRNPYFSTAESQRDQFISISLLTGLFPLTCERVGTCICRESILFLWNSGFWEFEI